MKATKYFPTLKERWNDLIFYLVSIALLTGIAGCTIQLFSILFSLVGQTEIPNFPSP